MEERGVRPGRGGADASAGDRCQYKQGLPVGAFELRGGFHPVVVPAIRSGEFHVAARLRLDRQTRRERYFEIVERVAGVGAG